MFSVQDGESRIYSCFIDFKKAFDTVWHDGLFFKLQQMGVNGNFLNTIKNIYANTECAVKIGDKLTNFFPCKQGVRQGDPLSNNNNNKCLFSYEKYEKLNMQLNIFQL